MLRIFRGERPAQRVAQPEQHEQDTGAQTGQQSPAQDASTTPQTASGANDNRATQATTATTKPASTPTAAAAAEPGTQQSLPEPEPGFLDRGRMRRRARFLRVARELAYRDLGGLVFDLHRFAKRNDEIVTAKLDTLSRIDLELRALESALRERRRVAVMREAGVAACPRCAAIHGSGDRFCPACGLSVDQAERPMAAPSAPAPVPPPSGVAWPPPASQPLQAWPGVPAAHQPAATPTAASATPPIPEPSDAASAASAHSTAVPVPARPRPRSTTAPAAKNAGADNGQQPVPPPAGEPDTRQSRNPNVQAADPPTEVIRSGPRATPVPGQTVAFDPITPSPSAEGEQDGEHRQDRS